MIMKIFPFNDMNKHAKLVLFLVSRFVTKSGITTSSALTSQWWLYMWTAWPMTLTSWQMTGPSTPLRLTCSWL